MRRSTARVVAVLGAMVRRMRAGRREELQILDAVVVAHAVEVVHNLARIQDTPEMGRHDESVLEHPAARRLRHRMSASANEHVPVPVQLSVALREARRDPRAMLGALRLAAVGVADRRPSLRGVLLPSTCVGQLLTISDRHHARPVAMDESERFSFHQPAVRVVDRRHRCGLAASAFAQLHQGRATIAIGSAAI